MSSCSSYYVPKLGDIVRRTRGNTPCVVIYVDFPCVTLMYASGYPSETVASNVHPWTDNVSIPTLVAMRDAISEFMNNLPKSLAYVKVLHAKRAVEMYIERETGSPQGGSTETETHPYDAINLEGMEDMKTLYEWKDGEKAVFGHKLAVNSQGKWVMEPKNGGDPVVVDKADVTEVMPYTVNVVYMGNSHMSYSFFAKEGDFEVGDIVFCPTYETPMMVKTLNTKSKQATKWLHGTKITGTTITSGED